MRISKFIIIGFLIAAAMFGCAENVPSNLVGPIEERQTYDAVGIVRNLNTESSEITIDHQDIAGYMSAMEMTFSMNDATLSDGLEVGDQIHFVLERTGSKVLMTRVSKIEGAPNGVKIYADNCAKCHGTAGEGKEKGIPLISGHALNHSEQEHLNKVQYGKPNKMPAFREKLSDEEIAAVVKFVREEIQKGASRGTGHKH